jgi:hypothetical protein
VIPAGRVCSKRNYKEKKGAMKAYISDLIVDAASSAFRGIAYASDAIVPRKSGPPPATPRAVGPPLVLDLALIRIEINFTR